MPRLQGSSAVEYQIVDPTTYPGWDELVQSHPDSSIFHLSGWAEVLKRTYGFSPHYILSVEKSDLRFALPLFEIRSVLTGRRGVSLPFSDYCDPLVVNNESAFEILPWLYAYGKARGWGYIELRTRKELPYGLSPSESFFRHELELQPDPDKIISTFRKGTVGTIRKAKKEGVEVRVDFSVEGVNEYYRLNCMTRREHGLPPQPYRFFALLHKYLISKGYGFVVLAEIKGVTIAGNLYLHFGDRAYHKYGASDRRFKDIGAGNLVMWEAIRWYAENGFRALCFGKTELFQNGLRLYKTGWGTRESKIQYLRYDLVKGECVVHSSRVKGFHNQFFRAMPIPVSRAIGSILYRHMA